MQYLILADLVVIRGHVAECSAKAAIVIRFNEDELDQQKLQCCLDHYDYRYHELLTRWHLHLKHVLQNVDHLGHCRVQQEYPCQ